LISASVTIAQHQFHTIVRDYNVHGDLHDVCMNSVAQQRVHRF
jgi:hypothetical protein